jgi:hypothetical protein
MYFLTTVMYFEGDAVSNNVICNCKAANI